MHGSFSIYFPDLSHVRPPATMQSRRWPDGELIEAVACSRWKTPTTPWPPNDHLDDVFVSPGDCRIHMPQILQAYSYL